MFLETMGDDTLVPSLEESIVNVTLKWIQLRHASVPKSPPNPTETEGHIIKNFVEVTQQFKTSWYTLMASLAQEAERTSVVTDSLQNEGYCNKVTTESSHLRGSCASESALSRTLDSPPDEGPTRASGKGDKQRSALTGPTVTEVANHHSNQIWCRPILKIEDTAPSNCCGGKPLWQTTPTTTQNARKVVGTVKDALLYIPCYLPVIYSAENGVDSCVAQETSGYESTSIIETHIYTDIVYRQNETCIYYFTSLKAYTPWRPFRNT